MVSRLISSRPLCLYMEKRQVLALKGSRLEITCLHGILWLTDGAGGERIIKGGQHVSFDGNRRGDICIEAFETVWVEIDYAPAPHRLVQRLSPLQDRFILLEGHQV